MRLGGFYTDCKQCKGVGYEDVPDEKEIDALLNTPAVEEKATIFNPIADGETEFVIETKKRGRKPKDKVA
jgi:hypothetical protein